MSPRADATARSDAMTHRGTALAFALALVPSDRGFSLGMARFALAFGSVGGLAFWAIRRRWRACGPGPMLVLLSRSRTRRMVAIRSTETVYRGWTSLRRATLAGPDGVAFTREIEDHGPAVAVLPYDPERRVALLVRLPRAPVLFLGGTSDLLEAPAGLREGGEDPAACARREAAEEAGVALGELEAAGHAWTMCGISTERIHLFLAPYAAEDRTGPGGGLAAEHENITTVEVALGELRDLADRGALDDLKTLCLVQTLRVRRPELFG